MRFVIVTQYFEPEMGAPQARLSSLVRELVKVGHDVDVVTAAPNYPLGRIFPGYRSAYRREVRHGAIVHRVWMVAGMGGGLRRLMGYASFVAMSPIALARCRRPDVVFVESPPLFTFVPSWLAARIWRRPIVLNVADLWPDVAVDLGLLKPGPALTAMRALERFAYRSAMAVNSVTDGVHQRLVEEKGVDASKVLSLPNGADVELFRPDRGDESVAARLRLLDRPRFVYTGTMGFIHGLDPVIEAMAHLQRVGVRCTLSFVGDGSERRRLEAIAAERGLENVCFRDAVQLEDVAAILPLALASVVSVRDVPVARGARPSKLFPAWAAGCAVVYVGPGEGAELVREAEAGLVVDDADPVAIARALQDLVADPTLAKRLGQNGRTFVEQRFSSEKLVTGWLIDLQRRLTEDSYAAARRRQGRASRRRTGYSEPPVDPRV